MWLFLPRTNWDMIQFDEHIFELAASTTYMVNGEIVGWKVFNLPTGSACSVFVRFQGVFVGPRSGEVVGNG